MTNDLLPPDQDDNKLTTERREKLALLRAQAKAAGVRLIHEVPFDGAGDKLVAFLHPKSTHGVLTELCQPKSDAAAH